MTEPHVEEHELLECHWIPWTQALDWVHDGIITDAKSIIGIHLAQSRVENFPSD